MSAPAPGAAPLLSVQKLTIEIDVISVVDRVSFDVAPGQVMALVGESGCGKSLTSFALLGLLPSVAHVSGGSIRLEGRDLALLSERQFRKLRGKELSIIFQEPSASLDPLSSVGSQIVEALRQHERLGAGAARERARQMLETVGIPDPDRRLDQYPFELSGGMCQRIMIAIALICGPKLLVADEPTTALDVTIQAQILDVMRRLIAERDTGIVFITHDMGVVADMADHVAVMYAGRIAEIGPVEAIFAEPSHPYTALLLASVPRLEAEAKSELATIPGAVSPPAEFEDGCRFFKRCPLATARCESEQPPLLAAAGGSRSACWHIDRVAELRRGAA